ncbi:SDR family oxidoreductase [Paenibacillus sp. FSL R5-0887]|jgi:NAD(P)-dependent dehydrogenase (short-subunit alcohol dehydrogenase family)|uniref:SDR family oxidoreductase n=1 Tax=Paenibacillus TaxID=44249 RepID=UPI00096C655A|nr:MULTISPECIES: SDR family oxidoreductase [Paenibacillus]MDH6426648.1 NAD(P)-dependent dehydrogenase (short-subunit alcohol dehydrogenase family) [Paenibacillus sp. PastH-4]MDH6442672.1 NAD(P)-dependent dehydrogenase (short-subunit alcohol dehydrogenase family) [Paenibacillus sp. PastF-4]MDH6526616.1 NAD(P)-dependent dehydrogenase (short-subunit alcohol dehydrogenase family) [Paenibacillus sp. PastH-3]OMC78196.1 short-chain dehydrogenase [Paenibacillus odorifer]OMD53871.1 short-chain dehydrog
MSSHLEYGHDRVALITGTSSGFGLLTALKLAGQGFKVIATMRDLSRKGELVQQAEQAGILKQLHLMTMDVTDSDSIETAISSVHETFGRIDVLVNNAGFAIGGFIEEISMEEWRRQMETNFFGLVAVTTAVLPIMREQQSGTIINVGSVSGLSGFPGYAPYAASKFAVEGFSESLRHEMSPYGIRVVLIEPGSFRTPIWGKGMEQIRRKEDSPYKARLDAVLRYSKHTAETAPDPSQVANLIGRITEMKAPRLRYPIGKGTRILILGKTLLPWKWLERIIAKELR